MSKDVKDVFFEIIYYIACIFVSLCNYFFRVNGALAALLVPVGSQVTGSKVKR